MSSFGTPIAKKKKSTFKGPEKRARKEFVDQIAESVRLLTKTFKYVSVENYSETIEKALPTNGENRFSMEQMNKLLSMGGLYKQ